LFTALSEVVRAINRGHARGEKSFNIKVRSILCTLVGKNKASDILKLCELFQNERVVGIDMASAADSSEQSKCHSTFSIVI
jgi:adenosine deaminase